MFLGDRPTEDKKGKRAMSGNVRMYLALIACNSVASLGYFTPAIGHWWPVVVGASAVFVGWLLLAGHVSDKVLDPAEKPIVSA